jgi:hypothetical protein
VRSSPGRDPCKQIAIQTIVTPQYYKCNNTPGFWKHKTRPICFMLGVDDFGVKYLGKEHIKHLIWCIKQKYELTKDWTGDFYCGIKLNWDYDAWTLDVLMPGYQESPSKI